MPRKIKTAAADQAALPQIPAELLEKLIPGLVTAGQFADIFPRFKKAFIQQAPGSSIDSLRPPVALPYLASTTPGRRRCHCRYSTPASTTAPPIHCSVSGATPKNSSAISTANTGTMFCHIPPVWMPRWATPVFQATVASAVQNTAAITSCSVGPGAGFRLGSPTSPVARAAAQNSSSQDSAPMVVR